MAITPAELATVRYVDYDYWVELSGGTCRAVDAAPRIRLVGLPLDEIAGQLGLSVGAVKARLHRARAALARLLAPSSLKEADRAHR